MVRAQEAVRFVPGELLVAPTASGAATLRLALGEYGLEIAERDAVSGVLRVSVPTGREGEWARRLSARDDVGYAERNGRGGGGQLPNDTLIGLQWHLANTGQSGGTPGADIDAEDAWSVTTGSSRVVIAVLDTGIDSDHPEFVGRIDPDGVDFVNSDLDPEADHPHGSWVTGLIAANADNGFAVAGVDWACKILPIKVLDSANLGTTFNLAQGLNYVATQADVRVVSMSLINYPNNATLQNALQVARNAGKILIACAGNNGLGDADVSYPGASPLTISVGATDRQDQRAGFSGTGAALDLVAPGVNVVTVRHDSSLDQGWFVQGCSFATPIVSGIAGLLLARAEELGLPALSHDDVRSLLITGAEDRVGPVNEDAVGRDDYFGHGRVNAGATLDALLTVGACEAGNVDVVRGNLPAQIVRVDGAVSEGLSRRFTRPIGGGLVLRVDDPPGHSSASFSLFARGGAPGPQDVVPLPFGIGDLCFTPSFVVISGITPWQATIPPLPQALTLTMQGLVVDTPQSNVAVTNLVIVDVR